MVVGGGNTAVEEALFLTNFASKVTMIHRRGEFRGERILQQRVFDNPKIEVVWNAEVEEVLGNDAPPTVTGVKVRDTKTGEITALNADGVFIAIGHSPATSIFAGKLDMKPGGYLKVVPGTAQTNIPGVCRATSRTTSTARRLRRRAWAALPHWRPKSSSPSTNSPRRPNNAGLGQAPHLPHCS